MEHNSLQAPIKFALFVVLAVATGVHADEVVLRDGTHLEGTVTIETSQKIVLKQSQGIRVIQKSDLLSLTKSDLEPAAPAPREVPPVNPIPAAADLKPSVPFWPPEAGKPYPDLALVDSQGRLIRFSSFKGKVLLIEAVATTCLGCQSMSGAKTCGGFGNVPADGSNSLEDYLPLYAGGLSLSDPRLVYIQLILYNESLKAPSQSQLKAWADHFKLSGRPNVYVVAGTPEMLGPTSYSMIPGFQLVDKKFVFRSEAYPDIHKGDLFRELLPMMPSLVSN